MNQILNRLNNEGWRINELKLTNLIKDEEIPLNYIDIKNFLLNTDIKIYGESWINIANKSDFVCNGVFQINKIKNVAAPDVDQDNKNHPPLFKFTITDGVSTVFLLDLQTNSRLNRNTEIGSKAMFTGTATYKSGIIILTDKININCFGGKVLDLIRAENMQKSTKNNRFGSDGPPKFIPFGNKLNINMQDIRKFKAMQTEQTKENPELENTDFGDKREAALAEIRKTKQGDVSIGTDKNSLLDKFHGGGTSKFVKETAEKQDQKDSNVAFLMSKGFSFTEVDRSLKANNYDVKAAEEQLYSKQNNQYKDVPDKDFKSRGRKNNRRGRNNSEEDDSWFDPEKYAAKVGLAVRPNTTISLAELMGTKPINETRSDNQNSHFNTNMINRGFQCLAEVMDGSFQPAVVVDILPDKYLRVQYLNSGEMIETNVTSLKSVTGEKIFEHMVPNVVHYQNERKSANSYESVNENYRPHSSYRGRGRGYPNRRRGGRQYRGY